MQTKQINLKLPENLFNAANIYAKNFGFANIQELLKASVREKIYNNIEYDESYTKKELDLVGKIVDKLMAKGEFVSEEELFRKLKK